MPSGISATENHLRKPDFTGRTGELLVIRTVSKGNGKRPLLTKTLTKTADGWHKTSYDKAFQIQVEPREIASFDALVATLDEIKFDRHAMILRGPLTEAGRTALAENPNAIGLRRKNKSKEWPNPWFQEGAVQWEMLDFDDLPTDGIDYKHEPERFVRHVVKNHLPDCYHDVSCWWQLSASAGTKEGVTGVHLVYWHHQPVSTDVLRGLTQANEDRDAVDPALYQAVQPHYTARPIFTNCPDPIPRRDGVLRGKVDAVVLRLSDIIDTRKKIHEKKVKAKRQKRVASARRNQVTQGAISSSVAGCLALMGDGDGLQGFRRPIRDAVFFWTMETRPAQRKERHPARRNWPKFKDFIRSSARAAPGGSWSRIKERVCDAALDQQYQSARQKLDDTFGDAPDAPPQGIPLAQAETAIREVVREVLIADEPIARAVIATVGAGKTEQAFREIAALGIWRDKRVHMYVPTVVLAAEELERTQDHGIENARIHRSRDFKAEGIEPLCDETMQPVAKVVEEAGGRVRETVCSKCKFAEACGWMKQGADDGPGLVIMPADYSLLPTAKKADVQIFDESFWQKGIRRSGKLDTNVFAQLPTIRTRDNTQHDHDAENDLHTANSKLRRAIENWDDTTAPLVASGLTPEIAKRARGINHQRADLLTELLKKTPLDAMGKIISRHQKEHATARREAELWSILATELELATDAPRQIMGVRLDQGDGVLHMQRRADLKAPDIPTLVLDATAEPEILRAFLPKIEVKRFNVAAPHQRIIQIDDAQLGKSAIVPNEDDTPAVAKTKATKIQKLERLLEVARASHSDGAVGLNTYKGTEEALSPEALSGVIHDHFGNISGKDGYRDVALHITAGRPEPKALDAERMARALWYDSPEPLTLTGSYGDEDDWRWSSEGEAIKCHRRSHLDRRVDAIRRQVTTAALLQSDRTRGIRRTAENPVTWLVLTNEPLPIRVNEFCSIDDIWPTRFEVAASRGAACSNAKHMALMHPDLWATADVAMNDKKRNGWPEIGSTLITSAPEKGWVIPYIGSSYIGSDPSFQMFEYRVTGARTAPTRVVSKSAAAARHCLEKLGTLATFVDIGEGATDVDAPSVSEPDEQPLRDLNSCLSPTPSVSKPARPVIKVEPPEPRWGATGDACWNDDGLVWGSVVPLVTLEDLWRAVQELHVSYFMVTGLPPPLEQNRLSAVM